MRTFRLNKLVRDKIVVHTENLGGHAEYRKLTGEELNKALIEKIIEEASELTRSAVNADEIVDLQEIIDQLCANLKISRKELQKLQQAKASKNGGFKNGDFIETVTLPADNKWTKYYASDPRRFPEV